MAASPPPVAAADPAFRADVLAGLAAPIPAIPARWLYDRRGSELFEAITDLPEYYLTRTERALLERHSPDVAHLAGTGDAVVEFGSGSSAKTPILLRAVQPSAYVPIDISGEFLRDSAAALAVEFPSLPIHPVEADFMRPITLPEAVAGAPKLGFFPGSTIGNLVARTAVDLLRRINAELDGTIPVEAFRHRAIWNDRMSRIEMHLEALRDVSFTVSGVPFSFPAGATIHTENSHKYGLRDARLLLRAAGWGVCHEWTDAADQFALILAEAEAPRFAP